MARKRSKRKSGFYTPNLTIPKKFLIENDLFVNQEYSDWKDYRDGMRDWSSNFKAIKKIPKYSRLDNSYLAKRYRMNAKQKLLLKRRKARKNSFFF